MEQEFNTTENFNTADDREQNPDDYWRDWEEKRRRYRQYVRRLCSRIGFSLCILCLIMGVVSFVMILLHDPLNALLPSTDYLYTLESVLSYAVALPVMLLFLRKVPETRIEPKKMRPRKFFMFFVLAMGGGYIFNFIGLIIDIFISVFSGRSVEQLNPLVDVLNNMNWQLSFIMAIFAPVVEEFIFRKIILNRLRPLGDRVAIVYSAILFGLLHGNITQFLYATVIGIVFGYVAVKTGRIFYTVILHAMVNGYSLISSALLLYTLNPQLNLWKMVLEIGSLIHIGLAIGAIVIFFMKRKKVFLRRGDVPEGLEFRDYSSCVYLNPGYIVFACIMIYSMLIVIFFG